MGTLLKYFGSVKLSGKLIVVMISPKFLLLLFAFNLGRSMIPINTCKFHDTTFTICPFGDIATIQVIWSFYRWNGVYSLAAPVVLQLHGCCVHCHPYICLVLLYWFRLGYLETVSLCTYLISIF